jgi:hypothetical protein
LPPGATDDPEVDGDNPFPDESVDAFDDDRPDVKDNFHVTEIPDEFPDLIQQLLQSEHDQISMIDLEDQDSEEEVEDIYRGDNSVNVHTGKIHSHFHLAKATQENGSPMGFDANLGERGLKSWAKAVSKTARKCGDATFVTQTAKRTGDHLLLAKARRIYEQDDGCPVQPARRNSPLDMSPGTRPTTGTPGH